MMWTDVLRLEAVMLNGIELLADSTRMSLTHVPNTLEKGTMCLRTLGQTLVQQRLEPVLKQSALVFDLGIAVTSHAFKLTQEFGMGRIWPSQLFQLLIEFRDPLVVYSVYY